MDGLDSRGSTVKKCQRIGRIPNDFGIRIITTHDLSRLWRECRAFVSSLQGDGRGGPFTQGGARRLRCLALPWANLHCPFGSRSPSDRIRDTRLAARV